MQFHLGAYETQPTNDHGEPGEPGTHSTDFNFILNVGYI